MFYCILFLALLAAAADHPARAAKVALPTVAPPRFSQVVGAYVISASAAPREIHVEGPIILTVRIVGKGPAQYRPLRQHLHIFPDDLGRDFHVEPLVDQDKQVPDQGLWEFVYRLRPKRPDVTRIPELELSYYAPEKNKFPSSYADEIAIKVTPRQPATTGELNLKIVKAPNRFYQPRPVDESFREDGPLPPPTPEILATLLALPPLLC